MKKIANARILLVEDDNDYLAGICRRLKKHGYADPDTARNEDEATACLDANHYDIIVADMRLGGNSEGGFAVVDEVHKRNITSVVIVLTANDTVVDCRKALRGGRCWDYINKTMEQGSALEELHASIQEALAWLNRWGNQQDEAWIQDNLDTLREKYPDQYIAVLSNTVIEAAKTENELKLKLKERRLPLFLSTIKKIEMKLPHGIPVTELLQCDTSNTDEGRHLEFKSTLLWDIRQQKKNDAVLFAVLKTIVAFLNTEGGTLLIGVEDNTNIYGIEDDLKVASKKKDQDGFELRIWDAIDSQIGTAFANYIKPRFEAVEGKVVCIVDVSKSHDPAFITSHKNKNDRSFYVRSGNNSRELDSEQLYKHLRMKKWV